MKELQFASPIGWRRWLARNHAREPGVWIIFTKKGSGKPSMDYSAALDQALCYGWIDSTIRRIDDRHYARKFSPRRAHSVWSENNKKRAAQLIREKRLTAAGLQAVRQSQRAGHWVEAKKAIVSTHTPKEFLRALKNDPKAARYFRGLAPGYRCRFITWIALAKREQTRHARIRESMQLLRHNQKLGLK